MKTNNKLRSFALLWLTLSLIFIIPLNIQNVSAINVEQASNSFCGGPVEIRNSLVLSIVTLCLPGILEKTYEWKQIKCETIKCSYEAVKNDLDPSFCKKQDSYKTCKYIIGEAFAIPPMAILEYWRNAISQAIANPVGIAWGIGVKAIRYYFEGKPFFAAPVDGVLALILAVTDITAIAQQIMEIFEEGFFPPLSPDDMCEGIDDIKAELEEVVKYS